MFGQTQLRKQFDNYEQLNHDLETRKCDNLIKLNVKDLMTVSGKSFCVCWVCIYM